MTRALRENWKPVSVLGVTAVLIVPLLVFGGPAFARSGDAASSQYEYSSSTQYQMTICHHTHSAKHPWVQISISSRAWPAHQRHGDTVPPCPTTTAPKSSHGKSQTQHGSSETGHASSQTGSGQSNDAHGRGKH